jgi:hypothetical protein
MLGRMLKASALVVASIVFCLLIAEGICRLLPVQTGREVQVVDAGHPFISFKPNREFTFSNGSLLTNARRGHINNFGFVNDQDYRPDDPRPLLAVIGDSYIEAAMVPYPLTVQGRLAALQPPNRRVYSFGSSGSSLIDYLYYAVEAHRHFHADWLVINVVNNDFDEMLRRYKQHPAFHYLVEQPDGSLTPVLLEYHPGLPRKVLRHSALARYLIFNVGNSLPILNRTLAILRRLIEPLRPARAAEPSDVEAAEQLKIELSKRATLYVLDHLPEQVGLPVSRVLFLIDGYRIYEPGQLAAARFGYFGVMRAYFIEQARQRGYEVVDMQDWFARRHERDGSLFQFPDDGHWNALGHEEAANAVLASALYADFKKQ